MSFARIDPNRKNASPSSSNQSNQIPHRNQTQQLQPLNEVLFPSTSSSSTANTTTQAPPPPSPAQQSLTTLQSHIQNLSLNIKILHQTSLFSNKGDDSDNNRQMYAIQCEVCEELKVKIETGIKRIQREFIDKVNVKVSHVNSSGDDGYGSNNGTQDNNKSNGSGSLVSVERAKTRSTLNKLSSDYSILKKEEGGIRKEVARREMMDKNNAINSNNGSSSSKSVNSNKPNNINNNNTYNDSLTSRSDDTSPSIDDFHQLQQTHLTETLLSERHAEIQQINTQMSAVNEIFKDLANIVTGQQEMVDVIEGQVEEAHGLAKSGLEQIEKANENQKGCNVM